MKTGLYEKPINKKLNKALAELTDNFNVEKNKLIVKKLPVFYPNTLKKL